MLNNSRDNDHLQSYRHKRNYLCIGEKNSCLIYNQKVKSWFNCEWWNVIWNWIGGNSILMFNFSSLVIIRNIWKCNNSIFVQKQLHVIQGVNRLLFILKIYASKTYWAFSFITNLIISNSQSPDVGLLLCIS